MSPPGFEPWMPSPSHQPTGYRKAMSLIMHVSIESKTQSLSGSIAEAHCGSCWTGPHLSPYVIQHVLYKPDGPHISQSILQCIQGWE